MIRENGSKAIGFVVCTVLLCAFTGCGTTRTSNTLRTATEQLLISDAIDRAVQSIDFSPLAGKEVFFDERHLYDIVDDSYLISSMRQHLLASGCILKDDREKATFVVEPRAGAIGTDNHDLLFGVPATNVPQFTLLAALPPVIPEIPIAKRRNQRGVAKIAVFAYRRESGEPAWQSGIVSSESTSNDIWVLGAGPFKRGTIHRGTSFAGDKLIARGKSGNDDKKHGQVVQLAQSAIFPHSLSRPSKMPNELSSDVKQATAEETVENTPRSPEVGTSNGPPVLPPPAKDSLP